MSLLVVVALKMRGDRLGRWVPKCEGENEIDRARVILSVDSQSGRLIVSWVLLGGSLAREG